MKKLTFLLSFLISLLSQSQTITVTADGRLQAICPTCPPPTVCPVCPPQVVKHDTIYLPADPINKIPTVSAGNDISFQLPVNLVVLNGSATDPDGTISGYSWSRISGPTTFSFSNQFSASTSVSNLVTGTYVFRLTATDNKGASAFDDVNIIVSAASTGGTTIPISFTQQGSTTELQNSDRGVEQWHNGFNVPIAGKTSSINVYYRFGWFQVEGATQGSYNWSYLDGLLNTAISKKQKFGFGIMTLNPDGGGVSYGGGSSYYPAYLHSLMQGESTKDLLRNGVWVPNYNSVSYTNRLLALHQAISAHLETGAYNGVKYKDVISYIDVRGYGSWGEWHWGSIGLGDGGVSELPTGFLPSISALKRIIDTHIQGFPNYRLVGLAAGLDGNSTGINIFYSQPEVAYYLLTAKNNVGEIGIRRDQWGADDSYLIGLLEENKASYNGLALKTLIMNKWKNAPLVGEPPGWNPSQSGKNYALLPSQVVLLHASSFGNHNYGEDPPNSTIMANVQNASLNSGYRYTLLSGSVTTGSTTSITLNWSNRFSDTKDRAPTYTDWDIIYYVNGVQIGKSSLQLKYLTGLKTWTDTFSNVPTGKLTVKIVDPKGYAKVMTLGVAGQNTDLSYTLTTIN